MAVVEALGRAARVENYSVGVRENGDEPCGGDRVERVVCRHIHFCLMLLPLSS